MVIITHFFPVPYTTLTETDVVSSPVSGMDL